ncbi:MAG: hypothetical protein LBV19_04255 [Streptococcaceae bacterium]|jgi:hypothetical protein|nr:hypothetical protein [Streptococcaceae bacterium]
METILFLLNFSLLLLHEMDAIRAKEWRMFIVLKEMAEDRAYRIFTLAHLPLYFIALYIFTGDNETVIFGLKVAIDPFMITHALVHYSFRNHSNNGFKSRFSKAIIFSMPVLAIADLCLLFFAPILLPS